MHTNDTYDWSSFDVHMAIASDADQAYHCWATAAGMEQFFALTWVFTAPDGNQRQPNELAQIGDAYHMTFHHPAELQGKVLLADPGKQFAITFGEMSVTITLEPSKNGTLIRLVQDNIPTDDTGRAHSHLNCRSCWIYYLMNLRSVIEHQTDLRDTGFPDNPVGIEFAHRWKDTQS